MLSIYPLNKMKTAADANDGNQRDEGVVLVGGTLRKKENHNVKLDGSNEVSADAGVSYYNHMGMRKPCY